ncbi:MAG: AraC family transcriptional regulator [Thiotrichaceae bacterium]|nr:AraC family transcriptional regulator [Thiotrichaceae bacterium]
MKTIALLLIGYSLFYGLILSLTHFHCENYKGQKQAQLMGFVLILSLMSLQLAHYFYLMEGSYFIHSHYYVALLYLIAPAFYWFSKPLLKAEEGYSLTSLLWHFLPIGCAFVLPYNSAIALTFIIGGLYLFWLAKNVYALREQSAQLGLERVILVIVFVIAVFALILGLMLPFISEAVFFSFYASSIGIAFFLINMTLSISPQLSTNVTEVARETYATSTLKHIDCDERLKALHQLMQKRKLYEESNLDLHTLSSELSLSSHQLSELMNTQLGKSFSRYLREQRITEAKKQLCEQPSASVLSIGLAVGFPSQSNFYNAFREIVGTTPGKFRQLQKKLNQGVS